jgi:outer membrane protein OmpA-like peptidoglycan-associated protein
MPAVKLLLACLAVAVAAVATSITAVAEEPNPESIVCALDPHCAKKPLTRSMTRSMKRGVTVSGGQAEQKLSIDIYVNFAYNSADLETDARIPLDRLGTALSDPRLKAFNFMIAGHTDAKGGDDYNQKLSERRAEAVRQYLIARFGIAAQQLSAVGYGKAQLLDPSRPEDGVNRRVQVINTTAQ